MIKTTIEWYTLDEKLPYDGKILRIDDDCDVLCLFEFKITQKALVKHIEQVYWIDKKFMMYNDGELVDYTDEVKYWAYVPEIGE